MLNARWERPPAISRIYHGDLFGSAPLAYRQVINAPVLRLVVITCYTPFHEKSHAR